MTRVRPRIQVPVRQPVPQVFTDSPPVSYPSGWYDRSHSAEPPVIQDWSHAMEYKKIALSCQCGTEPAAVSTFGLTDDHQLLIQWECAECGRRVYYLKSLADCWWACPV